MRTRLESRFITSNADDGDGGGGGDDSHPRVRITDLINHLNVEGVGCASAIIIMLLDCHGR